MRLLLSKTWKSIHCQLQYAIPIAKYLGERSELKQNTKILFWPLQILLNSGTFSVFTVAKNDREFRRIFKGQKSIDKGFQKIWIILTWICSTGPSLDAVILLSSIPCPFCTGRYSMTFSRPPRGLEGVTRFPLKAGSRPSEVGLQQSETRHVEGEHGLLSNCRTEDWLLRGRRRLDCCCCCCCCRDCCWWCCCSMTAEAALAQQKTQAIVEVVQSLHAALLLFGSAFSAANSGSLFRTFSRSSRLTRDEVCSLMKTMHEVQGEELSRYPWKMMQCWEERERRWNFLIYSYSFLATVFSFMEVFDRNCPLKGL